MAGTLKRLGGPTDLTNAGAGTAINVLTTATPAAGNYYVVRHIHIANTSAAALTFSLFLGATAGSAAGTELAGAKSIAAHDVYDWYGALVIENTKYLSGLATGAANVMVIVVEGEVVISSV